MTNQHPITPPPELVQQWHVEAMTGFRTNGIYEQDIATLAARWGADMELEACCEWIENAPFGFALNTSAYQLRAARRPKPPSLKEQALGLVSDVCGLPMMRAYSTDELLILRRALEALPND